MAQTEAAHWSFKGFVLLKACFIELFVSLNFYMQVRGLSISFLSSKRKKSQEVIFFKLPGPLGTKL